MLFSWSHRRMSISIGLIVATMLLVGCQNEDSATPPPSDTTKVFDGTPVEWTLLFRACLEEAGFVTADSPDGDKTGFVVSTDGITNEQRVEVRNSCQAEIGMPQMAGLGEGELRIRYDARVAQFQCLADLGLVNEAPVSFEKFVDDYNRSGQRDLWEPTVVDGVGLSMEKDGRFYGGTQLCPRDSSVW